MSDHSAITAPNSECWNAFVYSLSLDSAFNRVKASTQDYSAIIKLEIFLMTGRDRWENIFGLWNGILQALTPAHLPKDSEIATWNAIARRCNMPFTFDPSGYMRL